MRLAEIKAQRKGHGPISKKYSHLKMSKFLSRNPMIYRYLSHHYILRRSVVFIVDTEFSGLAYHDKANKWVKKIFD